MRRIIRDAAHGNAPLMVMGLKEARTHIKEKKEELKKKFYLNVFLIPFSPPLAIVSSVFTLVKYYNDFYDMFLSNSAKKAVYEKLFAPVTDETVYTVFGYRVYQEDLDKHFPLVNEDSKLPELTAKAKRAKKDPSLQIGFDVTTLTTHLAFIGTTGAGKTETILSFVQDILKSGGGFMMIDGKSDQTIEQKLYALCIKYGYDTQFLVNNYIAPEKRPPTNTFSPALSLKTAQLREFLNDLLPSGGEGNTDYFANRGKVALAFPITFMKLRQEYYKEPFSFSDLANVMEDIEFTFIYIMSFGMANELNDYIVIKAQKDNNLKKYLKKAQTEKISKFKEIENVDVLVEFMTRNPEKRKEIENILGIDIDFMASVTDLVINMDNYIAGVYPTWKRYALNIAKAIKMYLNEKNKNFLYNKANLINIKDIREAYNTLKNSSSTLNNVLAHFAKEDIDKETVLEAISNEDGGENLENLNKDNMRQHQYAQQQWDRVFQLFNMYKHVFNDLYPDVDLADVIKNNKVLYVMLPILNMANDQIIMIAKMYVILIKLATSLGLGGENQEALPLQLKIYQTKLKPLPLYMIVLDEWGSYATTGMATQNAQARSLKISMVYSTQDKASFLAEKDDREMKRILGNMKKLILKVEDEEMYEYVEKYVGEIEILKEQEIIKDLNDSKKIKADTTSFKIEKEPAFPVKKLSQFAKGMALFVNSDEPVVVQSYYVGGDDAPLNITRYKGFLEEWENV